MPDATFDWDKAEAEARKDYIRSRPNGAVQATYGAEGWDTAIAWVKRTAMLRMLGGPRESRQPADPPAYLGEGKSSRGVGSVLPGEVPE